ncbi:MAG: fibronectin type III domain-containing protein [Bacteroidetes bacterium]|nr:fibronectin type III domain-containing protein [Bacteroidota bacterium]
MNIQWSSYNEKDLSHFVIERSEDAIAFQQVATVKALGNSSTKTDYSFLDESVNGKQYHYRVQAVNLGKETAYSEIKSISMKCDSKDIKVYPNLL